MDDFPSFMKHPANRIARSNQATAGVEGYVFDGANGSQMAFWTCNETANSVSAANRGATSGVYYFTVGGP
jgi:hypothetical protein